MSEERRHACFAAVFCAQPNCNPNICSSGFGRQMTPVLTVRTSEPHTLPSLPPSPTTENVTRSSSNVQKADGSNITRASHDEFDAGRRKGKNRLVESPTSFGDSGTEDTTDRTSSEETDTDTESRRVEQNLRRWEATERHRRKVAREIAATSSSGSVVGDVTRRASLLWSGRKNQRPPSGVGSHRALRTQELEEGMPLEELDVVSPGPSLPNSPYHPDNPFEHPAHVRSDSTSSLNTPFRSAVMSESSEPTPHPLKSKSKRQYQRHMPPRPLDLPRPRTPPPASSSPNVDKPPESIPGPMTRPEAIPSTDDGDLTEMKEIRWWTDWLCGCREGPDRGGDHQAGRTNPMA